MVRTSPSITGATISAPDSDPRGRHHGRSGAEQEDEPRPIPGGVPAEGCGHARIELEVATARP